MTTRTRRLAGLALAIVGAVVVARRSAVTRLLTRATGTWAGKPDWPDNHAGGPT